MGEVVQVRVQFAIKRIVIHEQLADVGQVAKAARASGKVVVTAQEDLQRLQRLREFWHNLSRKVIVRDVERAEARECVHAEREGPVEGIVAQREAQQ
mgnify:CR=1 FL=1